MDQALSLCGGGNLMNLARKRLMIMPAPAPGSSESSTGILEQTIQVLDRLIKLSSSKNPGAGSAARSGIISAAGLKFNHAQCRFLDLQSFHDNLRNLVDEMASLSSSSREQCRRAALEIAKVARKAEALVMSWVASDDQEDSWLVKAILFAGDDGLAAAQQRIEQQWCVSVLEVVLAQFRAGRNDSFKHKTKLTSGTSSVSQPHQVPYWMIDRVFEIAEESQLVDLDRGLMQAVRLDLRNLLEKLRKLKHKHDNFLFRSLSLLSSRSRKAGIRSQELTSYLITKLETDEEDVDSFVEKLHENESWASKFQGNDHQALVGIGQFGRVHRSNFLGIPAAVKVTHSHSRESFWNEVSLLATVHHPRLAQLIFADISDEDSGECRLWTELLGTSLDANLEMLRVKNEAPELMVAVELMLQIAEGMSFLHRRGVLHRTLNAFNVLHVGNKSKNWQKRSLKPRSIRHELNQFLQVKITDFGLAKTKNSGSLFLQSLSDDDDDDATGQNLKPPQRLPFWQAPEVFKKGSSSSPEAAFTKKSDVYSFAMLCYQILSCQRPFSDMERPITESLLFRLVSVEKARPRILPQFPSYLSAMIERCWSHDPQQRLSFTEICMALRSFKGLLMRRVHQEVLPCTPSDYTHLTGHLGLGFLVRTIVLHQENLHGAATSPLLMMLQEDDHNKLNSWPFPVEAFVFWLANSVPQLEQDEGFSLAAEMTGDLMANWIGPGHDFEQAVYWYFKASSCRSKMGGSAKWKLGICVENGFGITKDEKRALALYKQSAREGCASGHVEVGRCFESGKGLEACEPDKAAAHYSKALEMVEKGEVAGIVCVDFLLGMMARAHREEDCVWAGDRIQEVAARSRVGRILVAGRDWCNVRELVGMLGDWKVKETGRRKAKMVLERLAMEEDILHKALLA